MFRNDLEDFKGNIKYTEDEVFHKKRKNDKNETGAPRSIMEFGGTVTVDAREAISVIFIFVVNILRLRMESTGSSGGDFTASPRF